MDDDTNGIIAGLTQLEIDAIYRMQHRVYWEADFVERCIERRSEGVGICNLPYASLAEEKAILDAAYVIYLNIEDCDVAYNDTLDSVVDEIERCIDNGEICMGYQDRSYG